jgi:predicted AAA+ superfamily ATPase
VNAYGDRGLRLIQVDKAGMTELPAIVEQVRDLPQKFIIFIDDLSFEEDDDAFKALKVVLEGNVTARAQNVVVYATSNRRHLVREYFSDRPRPSDQDEIQSWDTLQEKLSFSDRFGLTLTFGAADQQTLSGDRAAPGNPGSTRDRGRHPTAASPPVGHAKQWPFWPHRPPIYRFLAG